MHITTIHEARKHLSQLIRRAMDGEEIAIGRADYPLVMLVPCRPLVSERSGGQWRGRVWIADDFDDTPAEVAGALGSDRL